MKPLLALLASLALLTPAPAEPAAPPRPAPVLTPDQQALRVKMIADIATHPLPSTVTVGRRVPGGAIGAIVTRAQDKEGNLIEFPIAYIYGLGKAQGLVDGDSWKGTLYLAGTFEFKSPFEGTRTVRRLALTPDLAADLQIAELFKR